MSAPTSKKAPAKGKQGITVAKVLGIPTQPTAKEARESYANRGAETFADRRLLDIAEATQRIAFWVTFWSVLSLVAFGIMLLVMIGNSR